MGKTIPYSEIQNMAKDKKRKRKKEVIVHKIKRYKYILCVFFISILVYSFFTGLYYMNYKQRPADWEMTEARKNQKKCKEFRDIYETKFDSKEIRRVSDKCILAIMQEKIDYSEIFHYYIGSDGKAAFEATANVTINNDFLNPSANEVGENTYRTVEVFPDYQNIIQSEEVFYRIENGVISDNWFEFYYTILKTNYEYYYIDSYFEGFFTNPPDCYGINVIFNKDHDNKKITILVANNKERQDEFKSYIESVAKKNWRIDDNNGPLDYLLRFSLNYPNKSYMIAEMINEPTIDISDILLFSFRNCYIFDNKDPIICTNSVVTKLQILQTIIFYFGIFSCVVIPSVSAILENRRKKNQSE